MNEFVQKWLKFRMTGIHTGKKKKKQKVCNHSYELGTWKYEKRWTSKWQERTETKTWNNKYVTTFLLHQTAMTFK